MCDYLQLFFFIPSDFSAAYFAGVASTCMFWESLCWGKNEKWFFWSYESCLLKFRAFENLLKGFSVSRTSWWYTWSSYCGFLRKVRGVSTCETSQAHFYLLQNISPNFLTACLHGGLSWGFTSLRYMLHPSQSRGRFAAPAGSAEQPAVSQQQGEGFTLGSQGKLVWEGNNCLPKRPVQL